jgi:Rod binding domain-containing protein
MSSMTLTTPDTSLAMMDIAQHQKMQKLHEMAAQKDKNRIDQAAKEFEAVFIAEMMKPMFEGIDVSPPFGGGKAEEIFRSILLQEYGKNIASSNSIGVADHVKAELIKLQAGTTNTTPKTER